MEQNRKEAAAKRAAEHVRDMHQTYLERIIYSSKDAVVYSGGSRLMDDIVCRLVVENMDSVQALFAHGGTGHEESGITAVLNFASYKEPGGKFLDGSMTQEEALCHASTLYNVLTRKDEYYAYNREHLNRGLYLDRALYTPDILFIYKDEGMQADVITCAAPNRRVAQKYCNVSDEEVYAVMKKRIDFILNTAKNEGVETLILGAFGCGVFGNDAEEVAGIFKELLEGKYSRSFKKAVFAVPGGPNLDAFKKVFGV